MCAHNETLMMENKSLPSSQNVCLAATEIASKFSHQKCIWKFGLRGQGSLPIDFFKIVATKDPDLGKPNLNMYVQNKIEGTPILKLAMVKRLKVKKKIC